MEMIWEVFQTFFIVLALVVGKQGCEWGAQALDALKLLRPRRRLRGR